MTLYSVYCRRIVLHVRPISKDSVHKWGTIYLHALWLQNRSAQCLEDSQGTTRGICISSYSLKNMVCYGFKSHSSRRCLSSSLSVVLSYVGRCLTTGWSLIQGIIPVFSMRENSRKIVYCIWIGYYWRRIKSLFLCDLYKFGMGSLQFAGMPLNLLVD
jgi:hypothetical protein